MILNYFFRIFEQQDKIIVEMLEKANESDAGEKFESEIEAPGNIVESARTVIDDVASEIIRENSEIQEEQEELFSEDVDVESSKINGDDSRSLNEVKNVSL